MRASLTLIAIAGILGIAFQGPTTQTLHAQAKTAPAGQPAAPAATEQTKAPEEPLPAMSVPPSYRFDQRGRRDPFVNPIPPRVQNPSAPEPVIMRPAGLKGVMISEAKVVGVVASKEKTMNAAVIVAPGNRTYFAAPGDALYDGVVKSVRQDAVVFSVTRPDESAGRDIVRKVRPTSGERQ